MNTHLTNSSLVKSQIQRLNSFIINHFSSFNLIIWKETNFVTGILFFPKKNLMFGKSDIESTKVLTNIPMCTTEKLSYHIFSLCTGNVCFDLGFYKYCTMKVFYRQNRSLGDTTPFQCRYNKFLSLLHNIFIVSCLKTYTNSQ